MAYLASSISGLLTIMLAPPTLSRINDTKRSIVDGIIYNWSFLGGKNSEVIFPIIFMLLVGFFTLFKKSKTDENGEKIKYRPYNKLLILGIPFAAISTVVAIIAFFSKNYNLYTINAILSFIYIVITASTMLAKKETQELGKIIVCGFGTFFMMSVTTMAASRTCVPCILSLEIVLVIMFVDMLSELKQKFFSSALAIILVGASVSGYVYSYVQYKDESIFCREVYEELKSAKETGVIHSNWDRTLAMRRTLYRNKTLTDVYPLMYYQEKYEIPDDVKYIITSEKYTV